LNGHRGMEYGNSIPLRFHLKLKTAFDRFNLVTRIVNSSPRVAAENGLPIGGAVCDVGPVPAVPAGGQTDSRSPKTLAGGPATRNPIKGVASADLPERDDERIQLAPAGGTAVARLVAA
jgi:hypothetical protein